MGVNPKPLLARVDAKILVELRDALEAGNQATGNEFQFFLGRIWQCANDLVEDWIKRGTAAGAEEIWKELNGD